MKEKKSRNMTDANGYSHQLQRHRYLKVEPALSRNPTLRVMFMTLSAFSIGLIAGFNIKDLMIRTCYAVALVKDDGKDPLVVRDLKQNTSVVQPDVFTKLPDKFLANFPMPPPALQFPLRPWRIMEATKNYTGNGDPPYFLTILVKSAVVFAKRRFQIRQTWGSMSDIEGNKIAVIFVVGMAATGPQQGFLREENKLYGDIIQGDVVDSYRNLPSKVLSGFQFIVEYFGNSSQFFVSTDDDCFINVPNTYEFFSNIDPSKKEAIFCGFLFDKNAKRVTNMRSKWGVSQDIYPIRPYPTFCHGGMSILTFGILRDLYRASLVTNYTGFHLEDVLINGILREKLPREGDTIRMVNLRDRITNRRMGLVWHLGTRKDMSTAFNGLWSTVKRRLAVYDGPFVRDRGYRATIVPLLTLEGKSVQGTIEHFDRTQLTRLGKPRSS